MEEWKETMHTNLVGARISYHHEGKSRGDARYAIITRVMSSSVVGIDTENGGTVRVPDSRAFLATLPQYVTDEMKGAAR